mmetsp:Transcript_1114/g.1744  ORF Transcript_1114/g.1744 Transcript_1114/m.1744 type:complete len:107 (+) Transcript_1114:235-555(+)
MTLESTIALLTISAHEKQSVATADIAGAYLNADMDEEVYVRFTGSMMELLCEICPEYKELLVEEKGKMVLYVRLNKALYGCIWSALLWYELYAGTLTKNGFQDQSS